MAASQDVEASLADARSPAKASHRTTDSPPLSLVQRQPYISRANIGGQHGVVDAQTHSSPQGEDAGTPPRPMSPLLANANVGVAALGDTMIVAATDDVNYTPSP